MVTRDAEERHLDDPHDERDEESDCGDERHEDSAHAVVRCAAQTAEPCEPGQAGGWWSKGGQTGRAMLGRRRGTHRWG